MIYTYYSEWGICCTHNEKVGIRIFEHQQHLHSRNRDLNVSTRRSSSAIISIESIQYMYV